MLSYKEKMRKVKAFFFDVDGVLTNGDVHLFQHDMVRTMNSKDGYALQYAAKMSYHLIVITGGNSEVMKNRLLSLGVHEVHLSSFNKITVYEEVRERLGITNDEILYMGDDIPDYKVMSLAGVAACPQDAAIEIKQIADYQSPFKGGRHCVRDVIEQTLRVQDNWFRDEAFEW
jgi:3-deoxy-D-manno-octulosonate 8-phosphate phosphatase (KDO 8-P phosphatase)